MRTTTALVSLAASVALVAGTVAPATAATQERTDPTGDVSTFGSPSEETLEAADVVGLRGKHGDGKLVFTLTVDDLQAQGGEGSTSAIVRLQTPTGRDFYAGLQRSAGEKNAFLVRETDGGSDGTVACDGFAARVLGARDQYVFSIPRSCVNNPREVRFGAVTSASDGGPIIIGRRGALGGGQPSGGSAEDDARRDSTIGEEIRLGTRALANN